MLINLEPRVRFESQGLGALVQIPRVACYFGALQGLEGFLGLHGDGFWTLAGVAA